MDHFREIKNCLTWHSEGKFEVELTNGIITRLNFCEPGKGPDDTGKCLTSVNYKYLQAVHACLGDLFTFIEEENKRLGYSYAREEEIQDEYQSETKLRPLINYNHQLNENPTENKESLASQDRTQQDIELIA
ncbi:hypothetical protein [Mucilaginibacter sp.]|uniref:hypothetical protein n=1 Tax=Mucilaginibacter sp. TaxID=1882438 RepID=UPI002608F9DF|nr:hypothetical protein [Mucilaginibacter sp.]MDB5030481.1 hypothetical protein [Mucilaginibacter sp.]